MPQLMGNTQKVFKFQQPMLLVTDSCVSLVSISWLKSINDPNTIYLDVIWLTVACLTIAWVNFLLVNCFLVNNGLRNQTPFQYGWISDRKEIFFSPKKKVSSASPIKLRLNIKYSSIN